MVAPVIPTMKVNPGDVSSALKAGTLAAIGTTAAVAAFGQCEIGDAAAPLNATSHIFWGESAAEQNGPSVKYTLVGAVLNAGAVASWAIVQQTLFGRWIRQGGIERPMAAGAATAAIAYVTDYHLVPKRLTPGFEKRLSKGALAAMYGVLAITLAVGAMKRNR